MPSYDYQCDDCEAVTEVSHKITESPEVACEKCGSTKTKRLISAAAFHLKGSGWYKTDYGSSSSKSESGSNEGKSENKTSKEPESKPKSEPNNKAA